MRENKKKREGKNVRVSTKERKEGRKEREEDKENKR